MGLIVDSSELVSAERTGLSVSSVITLYKEFETFAISAITVAELQHGVRRADTPIRRRMRELFLLDVVQTFEVLPLTTSIASRIGDLNADLQMRGEGVALADLIIAATALEYDLTLATHNLRHFERVAGLTTVTRQFNK